MKKILFTMMAVIALSLSTKANDLSDLLTKDNNFISYVNEVILLNSDLSSMSDEERMAYKGTVAYESRLNSLIKNGDRLESSYQLFSKSAEKQIVIKEALRKLAAAKQLRLVDPNDCLAVYMALVSYCSTRPQSEKAQCYEAAGNVLMGCAMQD
jgi:hypothetical protein